MMADSSRILWIRGLFYTVFLIFLAWVAPYIVLDGSPFKASQIFFIASIITLGQFLCLYFPLHASSLLALFFCDAALFTILVRVSGASSSPFLVLFPILSALGPIVFRDRMAFALMAGGLLFSGMALGWGIGIAGTWISILAVGALSYYLARLLQRSDTALLKSEVARRRLENLQKVILANIPSGLVSIDSEGRVIQLNQVGQRILNVREEKTLHRPIGDLVPGLNLGAAQTYPGLERSREVVDYLSPEGSLLKLGYSLARLKDPDDQSIIGTLFVFQDLTHVLKMEEDLRTSEKLAAIGKLAAGIAHEIRNPLAGISGSAQLLSGSSALHDEDKQLLTIIQRESTRLDALITEFLEYVRPQQMDLKPVDLVEIAQQCFESLKVSEKWKLLNCQLTLEAPNVAVKVRGEPNKITQALLNLILNAGQAGASRVLVTIGSDGILEVRDNGSGISPEHQRRLFEPFFTTKDKGTGLGLAVSYKLIEAMDARIDVVSPAADFCEKGGSIFRIKFVGSENS
jgi:two-component system, NtrC family, sensor histidine kinase PilS